MSCFITITSENIALALWGHLNLFIKGYWIFNGYYTESVGNLKDIIKLNLEQYIF